MKGSRSFGRGFRLLNQHIKCRGIMDSNFAQHFPVQKNAGVHQPIHESAVARATHSAGRRDAGNPEASHVTATLTAITPSVRAGPGQRDLGLLLVTASGSPVAAGGTKNSFAGFGASSTRGKRHKKPQATRVTRSP